MTFHPNSGTADGRVKPCAADCRHPLCVYLRGVNESQYRDERQARVLAWARACFGDVALSRPERAARVLEEALELAQAEGGTVADVHRLTAHVFGKPVGDPAQELGGLGVTLLAYAAVVGLSADSEEAKKVARITALPSEHFRKRQNAKANAGVAVRVAESELTSSEEERLNEYICEGNRGNR